MIKRNKFTLEIEASYQGFDSPYDLEYRSNFNEVIVRGANFLWKIDLNSDKINAFAGSDGWKITDFSVSPNLVSYIMEKDSLYKARVLGSDLYSMLLDYETINKMAYTKWMNNETFFLLEELLNAENYGTISHIFDAKTKKVNSTETESTLLLISPESSEVGVATNKIEISSPSAGEKVLISKPYIIKWISSESDNDNVSIDLLLNGTKVQTISSETKNSGVFEWNIDNNLEISSEYQINITWKSAQNNPDNSDITSKFILTDLIEDSSSSDLEISVSSKGIHFNNNTNSIVNVLEDGSIGEFFVDSQEFLGFISSETNEITANEKSNLRIFSPSAYSKLRAFVGSEVNLNDKWDSGVIETKLSSIYYGGGNNLELGQTYYFNIQFYDEKNGWSRLQTKEFKMIL